MDDAQDLSILNGPQSAQPTTYDTPPAQIDRHQQEISRSLGKIPRADGVIPPLMDAIGRVKTTVFASSPPTTRSTPSNASDAVPRMIVFDAPALLAVSLRQDDSAERAF